jgi:hypothetical protein
MGDPTVAAETITDDVRRRTTDEVQILSYLAAFDAWTLWPNADKAIERLLVPVRRPVLAANGEIPAALLARIGLRVGRMDVVATAAAFAERATGAATGPFLRLVRAAIRGLVEPGAESARALERTAEELLDRGYRLPAAEVLADAAIVAQRAGLEAEAPAERARALFADCSVVPVLGDPVDALAMPAVRPA